MIETVIAAEKLTKVYTLSAERIYAVNEVDLHIEAGEFVSIMGPSGSGKTTLLDLIGCLDSITSGHLEVLGHDVSHVAERHLVQNRRGAIGFVFQDFLLIPSLTALENVELPLQFARLPRQRQRSIELLRQVGLGQRINHLPKQMSGGEKQRVAIARALATSPKLLLADEPTGNLDTRSAQEIFDIFDTLHQEQGLTIVVTTHNPKLGALASRTIYLQDGRIVLKEMSSLHREA
jgi:putative ABC transport system ATP-binding protein